MVALRTGQWRLYDAMWGLHIMDLQTRDNTHHPILILFATLATIGALLGCVLLFRRRTAKVRASKGWATSLPSLPPLLDLGGTAVFALSGALLAARLR